MSMGSFSKPFDNIHVDPCRRCRGLFFRGNMREAAKVKLFGKLPVKKVRGYYCRECAFRMDGETQGILPL